MRHRFRRFHGCHATARGLAVVTVLLVALLACTFNPNAPPGPTTDFYVSVKGSDTSGDGSQAKPWRHIQYAVDHAQPAAGSELTLHLLKGIYQENLLIKRALSIIGAGVGSATPSPSDPLTPVQDDSVIVRDFSRDAPGILIQDSSVALKNLVVLYGGLRAVNSRFFLTNVEVQDSRGLYGVQIERVVTFTLDHVKVTTGDNLASDYGIDIEGTDGHAGSGGDIINSYVGDQFDHAINIVPFGPGQTLDPNAPYRNPLTVQIAYSQIAGSNVYWADGIRIQGAADVDISNTTITRSHPDNQPASAGEPHNLPYAGVEIAGYLFQANTAGAPTTTVRLDKVSTSGFDVGVGINVGGTFVEVQRSNLAAVTYDVETFYTGYPGTDYPQVSFGGSGPYAGTMGQNTFAASAIYAFYHQAPYDVSACNNTWGVATGEIDTTRIHDQLDDGSKGRVTWNCS